MLIFFILAVIPYFFNAPATTVLSGEVTKWGGILGSYALILGFISLVISRARTAISREKGDEIIPEWGYALLTVVGTLIFFGIGVIFSRSSDAYQYWITYIFSPTSTAIARLKCYFLVLSLYRLLRIKDIKSLVFFIAFAAFLWGSSTLGNSVTPGVNVAAEWLQGVLAQSVQRGLFIAAYMGEIFFTLRYLIGRQGES
jgi:hypothetical protein